MNSKVRVQIDARLVMPFILEAYSESRLPDCASKNVRSDDAIAREIIRTLNSPLGSLLRPGRDKRPTSQQCQHCRSEAVMRSIMLDLIERHERLIAEMRSAMEAQ